MYLTVPDHLFVANDVMTLVRFVVYPTAVRSMTVLSFREI